MDGHRSKYIDITRGVKQGCALSPLIFNMALEVLAIKIIESENLKGFVMGEKTSKISLYADDILCYLGQPEELIRSLRYIISEFGVVSGYKINSQKLVLWGINLTEIMRGKIQEMWPRQWQDGDMKYLGIRISKTNENILGKNVTPLIAYVQRKCKEWDSFP